MRRRRGIAEGIMIGTAVANNNQRRQQTTVVAVPAGYPVGYAAPYPGYPYGPPPAAYYPLGPPQQSTTEIVVNAAPEKAAGAMYPPPPAAYPYGPPPAAYYPPGPPQQTTTEIVVNTAPEKMPPPAATPYNYPPPQAPGPMYPPPPAAVAAAAYPPPPPYAAPPPAAAPPPVVMPPAAVAAAAVHHPAAPAPVPTAAAIEAAAVVKAVERRHFLIVNEANCSVLEAQRGNVKPNTLVVSNKRRPDKPTYQIWYMDEKNIIRSKLNDFAMESKDKGSNLHLVHYNGDARQRWTFKDNRIVNEVFCNDCIGLKKGIIRLSDDADVISGPYEGKPFQHWRMEYI